MAKIAKSISFVLSAVVVAVMAAVIAVSLFADGAVRVAIENAGTKTLHVPVTLEKAKLSLLGGFLDLRGLTIGNPPGYQHKTLMELQQGNLQVDKGTLFSHEVTIKDVNLDGVILVVEQKGLGNNLQDVLDSLPKDGKSSGKRLYIDNLEITDITVDIKLLPVPGQVDTIPLKLSPIKMTDLGRDERLDTGVLTAKILLAIAGGIAQQGRGVLPEDMLGGLEGIMDKAFGVGKAILSTGQEGESGLQKAAGQIGENLSEGFKRLTEPKDDK
jgi:hypothetical protein